MASMRSFQPLARRAPRTWSAAGRTQRRFINIGSAPVIFSSHATVTGGRAEGHINGDHLKLDLGMPKELGGDGSKPNPEELFAAGYASCFQSAMAIASQQVGVKMPEGKDYSVQSTVHLIGDMKAVDLGIRVDMQVKAKGVSKSDLEKVIAKTTEICPYSRATKGNVVTNVEAVPL